RRRARRAGERERRGPVRALRGDPDEGGCGMSLRLSCLFVLAVALAAPAVAAQKPAAPAAETLSLDAYRERLAAIDRQLRGGDWRAARDAAARLRDARVDFHGEALRPDRSLLS